MLVAHTQQAARSHTFGRTLDLDDLRLAKERDAFDQPGSRCAEHHAPRRSY